MTIIRVLGPKSFLLLKERVSVCLSITFWTWDLCPTHEGLKFDSKMSQGDENSLSCVLTESKGKEVRTGGADECRSRLRWTKEVYVSLVETSVVPVRRVDFETGPQTSVSDSIISRFFEDRSDFCSLRFLTSYPRYLWQVSFYPRTSSSGTKWRVRSRLTPLYSSGFDGTFVYWCPTWCRNKVERIGEGNLRV